VIEYLKRIIRRFRSSGVVFPPSTNPPENPDAGVREPRWGRRPSGGTAVAVAEPDEQGPATLAIGRNRRA
jgi:hypothetical protein